MRIQIAETGKSQQELSLDQLPLVLSGLGARIVDFQGSPFLENAGSRAFRASGGALVRPGERHRLRPGTVFFVDAVQIRVLDDAGASGSETVSAADETSRSDTVGVIPPTPDWGHGLVNAFEARLLFPGARLRAVELRDREEFVVGREDGEDDVYCAVDRESVSRLHARIAFDGRSFIVEDLGSTNGTFVMGERLLEGERRRLAPETVMRFGSVYALFVVIADADCKRIPAKIYEAAFRILIADGIISRRDLAAARGETYESVRDGLLSSGAVTADTWSRAFRRAVALDASTVSRSWLGADRRWRRTALGLLAVVLVLLILVAAGLYRLLR